MPSTSASPERIVSYLTSRSVDEVRAAAEHVDARARTLDGWD